MELKTLLEAGIKNDTMAVPFRLIKNALDVLEYGSSTRVMFMLLALTGCRIKEVERIQLSLLRKHPNKEGWALIYWKCGKNQTGFRCEELPPYFMQELVFYRKYNRTYGDRLLSPCAKSFRKYFNKYRSQMNKDWCLKWNVPNNSAVRVEHIYSCSGLRKSFATLNFAKELDKWKSPDIALEMVSKRLKHSCTHMTAHHYIKNFEHLEIDKYKNFEIWQILKQPIQTKLNELNLNAEKPLSIFV